MQIKKIEDCRRVYRDIVAGYSVIKKPFCYLKHLREIDLGALENKNDTILEELKAQGIPSEKEVLIALDSRGIWEKKDEENYWQSISSIKDLQAEQRKIVSREQVEDLLKIINQRKEEVRKISEERDSHLRISAEYFVRKKSQEEIIKISFFKDEELKQPLFNQDEFDNLDFKDLAIYFSIFNEFCDTVNELNIKKIATTPFFLNSLSLAGDDAQKFYGRPIVELSLYQCDLFNHGKLNRTILEQGDSSPPENYDDLDKIVLFFDANYSILLGKIEQNKRDSKHNQR